MASSATTQNANRMLQLSWYKVRDMLLGASFVKQDVVRAIELAQSCEHVEAHFLKEIFAGRSVTTKEEARAILLSNENSPQAVCFAEIVMRDKDLIDWDRVRRSAELGFAFAEAILAEHVRTGEECFYFAQKAAAQGERNGFHMLGRCLQNGSGCEKDLMTARENFFFAAELGHVQSMVLYGEMLDDFDPQRWLWLGIAASHGAFGYFLGGFSAQVVAFNAGHGVFPVIFAIGRALKGNVSAKDRLIFGTNYKFDSRFGHAMTAIGFFSAVMRITLTFC